MRRQLVGFKAARSPSIGRCRCARLWGTSGPAVCAASYPSGLFPVFSCFALLHHLLLARIGGGTISWHFSNYYISGRGGPVGTTGPLVFLNMTLTWWHIGVDNAKNATAAASAFGSCSPGAGFAAGCCCLFLGWGCGGVARGDVIEFPHCTQYFVAALSWTLKGARCLSLRSCPALYLKLRAFLCESFDTKMLPPLPPTSDLVFFCFCNHVLMSAGFWICDFVFCVCGFVCVCVFDVCMFVCVCVCVLFFCVCCGFA